MSKKNKKHFAFFILQHFCKTFSVATLKTVGSLQAVCTLVIVVINASTAFPSSASFPLPPVEKTNKQNPTCTAATPRHRCASKYPLTFVCVCANMYFNCSKQLWPRGHSALCLSELQLPRQEACAAPYWHLVARAGTAVHLAENCLQVAFAPN